MIAPAEKPSEIEAISRQLQQAFLDCNHNTLVPRAFQPPVDSGKLTAAIEAIARLARAPLEEKIEAQQAQIQHLHEMVQRLRAEN